MGNLIVGFSRPKKFKLFAWAIMKAYGIDYDHVYVKFHSDTYDRDIIYQASSTMVNFMSNKIFDENNITVAEYTVAIPDDKQKALIQFAMDNAGKPYGILDCVGLAAIRLADLLFHKKIKNPFGDGGKTYVCCELGAYILEEFANLQIKYDLDSINPKELRSAMDELSRPVNG